jgi:hypothetical protein
MGILDELDTLRVQNSEKTGALAAVGASLTPGSG